MRRLSAAALVALVACGRDPGAAPVIPDAAISYVEGAVEPVLTATRTIVIEGYGFGATQGQGTVTFPAAGGGTTSGTILGGGWSDFAIEVVVPGDALSGTLTVTTDAGRRLEATVQVLPALAFDPAALAWQPRSGFPRAPVGIAVAPAAFVGPGGVTTTLFAAGGAEPVGGDSIFTPETSIHVARTLADGEITVWTRQPESTDAANRSLPASRAFAAAVVATRHNARLPLSTGVLYVIGGIDAAGRGQKTVYGADVSADGVVGRFASLEPLPIAVVGASAVIRRGAVYLIGGADTAGRPLTRVFVARVAPNGQLDGWYTQPAIPGPRAYGGITVLDRRVLAFGGVAAPVPPGGGLDDTPARLASADTATVSRRSGFFAGPWAEAGPLLPEPRSQFATLDVGSALLLVGGMYAGAATNAAETIAASYDGDSLGAFAGPVGTNTIAAQEGGTLVGAAGATWRDGAGAYHGLVVGGMDLATRLRRTGAWGF